MKTAFHLIPAVFALAGTLLAGESDSVARFSNNDRLVGSLEALSSELLVWKSPVFAEPAPFFLRNVIDLSLPGTVPEAPSDHEATVTLTNGDIVRGRLASVTDEAVSIDTWFAGRLSFNRPMVSNVRIEGRSSLLYRGPDGLDGWTQSGDKPAWTYGRSAFRSAAAGGIARDQSLPDECAVTFEVAWKADSIALKVILFSNEPSSDTPTSGYELSFQRGSVYLRNGRTQSFLGSTHSQALMEYDKVRIEVRASRKSGKVCLFINDNVIEVWSDPDVAKGRFGSCLHFVSQNTLPMRISNIGIAPWNGIVEQMPEPRIGMMQQFGLQEDEEEVQPEMPEPKPSKLRMELANGDSLEGEVTSIEEGMISVTTPLGLIRIPASRLRTLALKKVDLERCIRRNGDIRAGFPDGSSIVFKLEQVADGKLIGSSQNFGTAHFAISGLNRIEFNIYDPELEDKRMSDDW